MKDLIKELVEKAGLSQAQADAAARVVVDYLRNEKKRKAIVALAATTAAINVTVLPHAH